VIATTVAWLNEWPKRSKNHLRGSFIGKQLVDAEIDQERLQVDAILHGVRYLDRKFSWVKKPTMGGTVCVLHGVQSR